MVGLVVTIRRYTLSHWGPLKVKILIAHEATAAVSLLIGWCEAALIKGQNHQSEFNEKQGKGAGGWGKIVSHGLTDVIRDLPSSFQVDYGPVRWR